LERLKTPKLVSWAERRVVTDEAPEVSDVAVNQQFATLVASVKRKIDQNEISEEVLQQLSLIHWELRGKLLTFWQEGPNSPQLHNA
jgi:hypothetical protein